MRHLLPIFILLLVLPGCASNRADTIVSDVDDRTGESFTRLREPLRLATERPGLSVVGKDYLLVAPVFISGTPTSGQYLWFAVGTTVDRQLNGAPEPGFDRIVLVVDDSLMTFDLIDWREAAKAQPFDAPLKVTRSFASPVTDNQLRKIASAAELHAFVTNTEHRSPRYALVRGEPRDWLEF